MPMCANMFDHENDGRRNDDNGIDTTLDASIYSFFPSNGYRQNNILRTEWSENPRCVWTQARDSPATNERPFFQAKCEFWKLGTEILRAEKKIPSDATKLLEKRSKLNEGRAHTGMELPVPSLARHIFTLWIIFTSTAPSEYLSIILEENACSSCWEAAFVLSAPSLIVATVRYCSLQSSKKRYKQTIVT